MLGKYPLLSIEIFAVWSHCSSLERSCLAGSLLRWALSLLSAICICGKNRPARPDRPTFLYTQQDLSCLRLNSDLYIEISRQIYCIVINGFFHRDRHLLLYSYPTQLFIVFAVFIIIDKVVEAKAKTNLRLVAVFGLIAPFVWIIKMKM